MTPTAVSPGAATATGTDGTASAVGQQRSGFADWRPVVRVGLFGAIIAIYLCLVGIVPVFNQRPLINGVVSLGQSSLVLTFFAAGFMANRGTHRSRPRAILAGTLAGAIAGAALSLLVLLGAAIEIRNVLLNAIKYTPNGGSTPTSMFIRWSNGERTVPWHLGAKTK